MSRLQAILLTAAGLVVLAGILARGGTLASALRTGPRWRRRVITFALAALAAFGCISSVKAVSVLLASATSAPAGNGLESSKDWQEVVAAWTAAKDIAENKRGIYPFADDKEKTKFCERLDQAVVACERLSNAKLLTPAEAGLLARGLKDLMARVREFRPKTMQMVTCYEAMPHQPATASVARLQERLALLEQLAGQTTVQQAVLSRVLTGIEADLAVLASEPATTDAAKTRDAAATALRTIKTKLSDGLTSTKEWQVIEDAWKFCEPLATTGQSTTAQRQQVDARLEAAGKAIAALLAAGRLAEAEAQLLQQEFSRLREGVYAGPPTDSRVMCYDMAFLPPAQASLIRLAERLPLLQQLKTAGTLQPAVVAKLLPSLKADMQVLGDDKQLEHLPEPKRAEARKLREEAAKLLEQLSQP